MGVQPSDESGELYSRFYLRWKIKASFLCMPSNVGDDNYKGQVLKSRYRGKKAVFSTVFTTLFCTPGKIPGTGNQIRPETLLTGMGAGLTDPVVLPFAIATQEKAPIPTPLLTPAHGSLRSGVSRPVRFPSGGFCWEHSFFAASSRSRMEGFPWGSSRRPLLITPSIIL